MAVPKACVRVMGQKMVTYSHYFDSVITEVKTQQPASASFFEKIGGLLGIFPQDKGDWYFHFVDHPTGEVPLKGVRADTYRARTKKESFVWIPWREMREMPMHQIKRMRWTVEGGK